jgi:hypothetical protein
VNLYAVSQPAGVEHLQEFDEIIPLRGEKGRQRAGAVAEALAMMLTNTALRKTPSGLGDAVTRKCLRVDRKR